MATRYPTPPTSTITWLGRLSASLPRSCPIIARQYCRFSFARQRRVGIGDRLERNCPIFVNRSPPSKLNWISRDKTHVSGAGKLDFIAKELLQSDAPTFAASMIISPEILRTDSVTFAHVVFNLIRF